MRYDIVIIISLVLMLVMARQESQHQALKLILHIRALEAHVMMLLARIHTLETVLAGERMRGGPSEEKTEKVSDWQQAWAREFLRIGSEPITPELLRTARRQAILREHPDTGGTDERMRAVEVAINTLSSAGVMR